MYQKKVHHVYYKVRNSNQYDDNKMLSGNRALFANNQTPWETNVMYYRRNEYHFY